MPVGFAPFTVGFIVGSVVNTVLFIAIALLVIILRKRYYRGTLGVGSYSRVVDDGYAAGSAIEMTSPTFVIGSWNATFPL